MPEPPAWTAHARVVCSHPLVLPDGYMSAAALIAAGVPKALAAQLASAREMAAHALGRIRPATARLGPPGLGRCLGAGGPGGAEAEAAADAAAEAAAEAAAAAQAGTSTGAGPGAGAGAKAVPASAPASDRVPAHAPADIDSDGWADAGPALSARTAQPLPVSSSAWDTVATCHLLSITYAHDFNGAPGPASVWLASNLSFTEIARLPPAVFAPTDTYAEVCALRATTRHYRLRLLAVILTTQHDTRSLELVEYDVASASVVQRSTISSFRPTTGTQASVHASLLHNNRFIAVGWSVTSLAGRSASIAILSASDLSLAHGLITDTAAPFPDRPPTFDLSGRLLAYASTTPPPHIDTVPSSLAAEDDPSGNLLYQARNVGERVYHGASAGASGLAAALAASSPAPGPTSSQSCSAPAAGSSMFPSSPRPAAPGTPSPLGSVYSGTVHVMDLVRATRTKAGEPPSPSLISAFRAAPAPAGGGAGRLASVKFNPTGELLATADSAGHQFHIYALKTRAGPARRSEEGLLRPEWLYVIYRGITSAQVAAMEWSSDSRLLHVLTKRGTTHTVALHPWGALPNAKECVTSRGTNLHAYSVPFGPSGPRPMPLAASAKVSTSIDRFLPPQEDEGAQTQSSLQETGPAGQNRPSALTSGWPALALIQDTPGPEARRVGLYQFNASRGDVVQHQLLLSGHRPRYHFAPTTSASALDRASAPAPAEAGGARLSAGLASVGPKGQQRGGLTAFEGIQSLRALARSEAPHALWRGLTLSEPNAGASGILSISSAFLARVQRTPSHLGLGESVSTRLRSVPTLFSSGRCATAAEAEIHTYAKVPHAHDTHAYLVPQIKYGEYAPLDNSVRTIHVCAAHTVPIRRIEVRDDPRVEPGELAQLEGLADGLATATNSADWAYDRFAGGNEARRGALSPAGYSLAVPIPSFPVGVPARSRTWAQHVYQGIPLSRFTAAAGAAGAGAAAGLRAVSGAVGGVMGARLQRSALNTVNTVGRSAPTSISAEAGGMDKLYPSLDPLDPGMAVGRPGGGEGMVRSLVDAGDLPAVDVLEAQASGLPQNQENTDDFVQGGLDQDWNPALLGRGSDVSFSDSDELSGRGGAAARGRSADSANSPSQPLRPVNVAEPAVWGDREADPDVELDEGEEDGLAWALARGAGVGGNVADDDDEDDDDDNDDDDEFGWDGLDLSPDTDLGPVGTMPVRTAESTKITRGGFLFSPQVHQRKGSSSSLSSGVGPSASNGEAGLRVPSLLSSSGRASPFNPHPISHFPAPPSSGFASPALRKSDSRRESPLSIPATPPPEE